MIRSRARARLSGIYGFVVVTYRSVWDAFIDGRRAGPANRVLFVPCSQHQFDLGAPADYSPPKQSVNVINTSPMPRLRALPMTACVASLAVLVLVAAAGCLPVTPRLHPDRYANHGGFRWNVADSLAEDDTLFFVTLSGGGTRAAAFAYGVLQELDAARRPDGRTLLDGVDVISSVSGGSFAAAYLALYGKQQFFENFPAAVLHRNLELGFALRILNPLNWPRLLSPRYGRGDLAADYYSGAIFDDRTFKSLEGRRPFVVLNATDIARGAQFSFVQDHFDRLCADLETIPIGRAVAASSAFPVVFTPLTFENRPKDTCGYAAPTWVVYADANDLEATPQRWDWAQTWRSYEDATVRRYIHLSDGGLADNIGLRWLDAEWKNGAVIDAFNDHRLRRIVVIVVDAKPRRPSYIDRSARPPSFLSVIEASATTPMENYSSETVQLFRPGSWFDDEWVQPIRDYEERRKGCDELARVLQRRHRMPREAAQRECYERLGVLPVPPAPELHMVHVRFDSIDDPEERLRLQGIGTRLRLGQEDVKGLVTWGARLLQRSAEYQKVRAAMQADGR